MSLGSCRRKTIAHGPPTEDKQPSSFAARPSRMDRQPAVFDSRTTRREMRRGRRSPIPRASPGTDGFAATGKSNNAKIGFPRPPYPCAPKDVTVHFTRLQSSSSSSSSSAHTCYNLTSNPNHEHSFFLGRGGASTHPGKSGKRPAMATSVTPPRRNRAVIVDVVVIHSRYRYRRFSPYRV